MDFENILSVSQIIDGFSIRQKGNKACLFYRDLNIAQFCTDDYTELELKSKVSNYIDLNNEIMSSYKNMMTNIYSDSFNQVKDNVCYSCGKECRRMCKLAKLVLEQLCQAEWMYHVMQN